MQPEKGDLVEQPAHKTHPQCTRARSTVSVDGADSRGVASPASDSVRLCGKWPRAQIGAFRDSTHVIQASSLDQSMRLRRGRHEYHFPTSVDIRVQATAQGFAFQANSIDSDTGQHGLDSRDPGAPSWDNRRRAPPNARCAPSVIVLPFVHVRRGRGARYILRAQGHEDGRGRRFEREEVLFLGWGCRADQAHVEDRQGAPTAMSNSIARKSIRKSASFAFLPLTAPQAESLLEQNVWRPTYARPFQLIFRCYPPAATARAPSLSCGSCSSSAMARFA